MAREKETVWAQVRRELCRQPIVEGRLGGAAPLYVERYIYQAIEATVSGLDCAGLVTQFGGARVSESDRGRLRHQAVPTQSLLIPPGVPTHWQY